MMEKRLTALTAARLALLGIAPYGDSLLGTKQERYVDDPDNVILSFDVEGPSRKSRPGFRWVNYSVVIPKAHSQAQIDAIVAEKSEGKQVKDVKILPRRILSDA